VSNIITQSKLVALVKGMYNSKCEEHGHPPQKLKQVVVGRLSDPELLATTTQLLGGSHLAFTDEFIGTKYTALLLDTIKHELAHIWAGVEHQHDKHWQKWAKRFGAKLI